MSSFWKRSAPKGVGGLAASLSPTLGSGLLLLAMVAVVTTQSQTTETGPDQRRRLRLTPSGVAVDLEAPAVGGRNPTNAPAGFDNLTNGMNPQGPAFTTLNEDTVVALRSFNDNRFIFEEVETIGDGLGPTFNAQSCRECHQNVVTGGASQIAEHRTGHLLAGQFFESLGGSLAALTGHPPGDSRNRRSRRRRPDVQDLDKHPGRRLRRSYFEQHAPRDPGPAAIRDAWYRHCRARAGSARHDAHRALWMEESAREPRVFLGGRIPE